jgi:cell division protease FtsH
MNLPEGDPLHKVTIIPRGRALGVTMSLPERDRLSYSKKWCDAKIAMCFGGRIAEQLVYGEEQLNSGASDDIRQATNLARAMVTEWGMSDKLGPLRYSENEQEVFLGHSVTQRKNMSDQTASMIDAEIRRIVENGEKVARKILSDRLDDLHKLTKGLLEYETLSFDEVKALLADQAIHRDRDGGDQPKAQTGGGRRASVPTSGPTGGKPGGMEPEPQPGA